MGLRDKRESLRLALPSDGELYEPTLHFLDSCGMAVERASARRYTAQIASLSGVSVLFQRTADISVKVEEGSTELGVVGLDRFLEFRREGGNAFLVFEDLGFSRCELVLAVPDAWVDVTSMADLAELAVEFRGKGRELRVATKYPRLAQGFLYSKGITHFTLVQASGTFEAAPAMGYADIIADISSSGTTLRENHLKPLLGGTLLVSQACLIANRRMMRQDSRCLERAKAILERIEARLRAQEYFRITANIEGTSPEAVAARVLEQRVLGGLQGPTVAPVYSAEGGNWYAVTVLVSQELLLEAVDHLRAIGASGITFMQPRYLFHRTCEAYEKLLNNLEKE